MVCGQPSDRGRLKNRTEHSDCARHCRATSAVSWGHLSALSVSGLLLGACALTCALCCCCRRRQRRRRRRQDSLCQHDLYDDDDDDEFCACAGCCPTTSALYACKHRHGIVLQAEFAVASIVHIACCTWSAFRPDVPRDTYT